jgi:G3E family GTPase
VTSPATGPEAQPEPGPVPVVLVTGVDPEAMASTVVGLQFDLPGAVAVRHDIDPEEQTLTRTVSDVSGLVEREVLDLDHACVACALREDVVPTILRLATSGRWDSLLVHLPVGASAHQVCAVLEDRTEARVSGVVAALAAEGAIEDLLGDVLLRERGLHSAADDARGIGEVGCAMVEYADAVVLVGTASAAATDLARALARPDAPVVSSSALDVSALSHDQARTAAWVAADRTAELEPLPSERVWRVELRSERAFHPDRLLEELERLGGGRHRSRGCFWLPTRPGRTLVWDGSGGQLSVGDGGAWTGPARTRLVLTGVGAAPQHLEAAFEEMLVRPGERSSLLAEDGFEPWLGPLRDVA